MFKMETSTSVVLISLGIIISLFYSANAKARIINGQEAAIGQIPYQASLTMTGNDGGSTICGGSLIGTEWVLTAAHCVSNIKEVTVRLGSIERTSAEQERTVDAGSVTLHPDYNSQNYANDIALIKISAVDITDHVQVISLPGPSDFSGQNGIVSGWGGTTNGLPDKLQYTVVPIISNDECNTKISVWEKQVCTDSSQSGFCGGDSGGPLATENNRVLVGVVSLIVGGCESKLPNIYTRVTEYLQWIQDNTGISN